MNNYQAHATAIVEKGCCIGQGTKIWHFSHIMPEATIGEDCIIGQNVFIGSGVNIGNRVKIQNNVSVFTGVSCEDDVFLGPSCVFTNVSNPRSAISRKDQFKTTIVGKGASIGANATVLCGCIIGEYALIGAGSVVTKNVPPYALIIGNPGKQIGWVSQYGNRLHFNQDNIAVCEESGQMYQLADNKVSRIDANYFNNHS
ncbi:MAG: N-acetyltransferase [Dysgonamonadaceae bacterium]|jgi:UDP-2-acetamido-3-amino-2,3-dideoxy-glucuronate N-acetyltransferase|nr:N-acetyltransferase [Dysgonamonadaceae bacterium]